MTTPRGYLLVAAAGIGLYALAVFAALSVYPAFWTSRTMGSDVPWYFMGQAFINGVAAAVALLLCAILGMIAARTVGPAAWHALMPAFLFLCPEFGGGVAVLLHSRRIWAGPDAAESDWLTFADYASGTSRGQFIALAIGAAIVFGLILLARRRAAADHGAPDSR